MPGRSVPSNCRAESVIPGYFPVENQMYPFAPRFAFHRDGRGGLKSVRLCNINRQAREKNWALIRNRCQPSPLL
jgi:hypothetical protein